MDDRIATGGTYLVELRLAVGAPDHRVAAAGIAHLHLKLIGVRAAAEGGVHHLSPVIGGVTPSMPPLATPGHP